ncbi:hypothetical protein M3Y95_00697100 [Aphelenchoides besseyi]|nr:hypothetical protein M3Y95_00697100 [Aphelenchoides besseyi]
MVVLVRKFTAKCLLTSITLIFRPFSSALEVPSRINDANSCVLRCKDNYMHEMQSLFTDVSQQQWSLNLITPLQNLFSSGGRLDVYTRFELACSAHDFFTKCLDHCRESRAKSIVQTGQNLWHTICDALADDRSFQTSILPCWVRHSNYISNECHFYSLMVQNSVTDLMQNGLDRSADNLDEVCRSITLYDKCYIGMSDQFCGPKGWQFLLNLNTKNSMSFLKLISENTIGPIPNSCTAMTKPEEYARMHAQRVRDERSTAIALVSYLSLIILTISVVFQVHFVAIN